MKFKRGDKVKTIYLGNLKTIYLRNSTGYVVGKAYLDDQIVVQWDIQGTPVTREDASEIVKVKKK
ncbi:MAG: hypothetical protein KGO96_07120 [Elusimicrobia bacterium]|nr:hypothetical protein [Elusimicrobiota bacterium]